MNQADDIEDVPDEELEIPLTPDKPEPEQEEEDEVTISIAGESPAPEEVDDPAAPAPEWVKELRKRNSETARRNRELEKELAEARKATQPAKPELGQKPTLESCDYDTEKYERESDAWRDRKAAYDAEQRKKDEQVKAQQATWQTKLDKYAAAKGELKVKDFDDAEEAATAVLSQVQQGVIVGVAKKPAVVIYALGKNPKKAKELAAITDPVEFAYALRELEEQLKVTSRKNVPAPERVLTSTGRTASGSDSHLEKLRDEAMKTGDMSKVHAYRRQLKSKK